MSQKTVTASQYGYLDTGIRAGKTLSIATPEGLKLAFTLATRGDRLAAQLIDLAILIGLNIGLAFAWLSMMGGNQIGQVIIQLLFFLLGVPLFIAWELFTNGRSPGKLATKLQVINRHGKSLGAAQIVLRNLMKTVEVFLPMSLFFTGIGDGLSLLLLVCWFAGSLAVFLFSPTRQRLGDYLAGTLVIRRPKPVLLPDATRAKLVDTSHQLRFSFQPRHLDHYGVYETQVLERLIRKGQDQTIKGADRADYKTNLHDVARTIVKKIGYTDPVTPEHEAQFILDFYRAQRAHLEGRQIMGERRENKRYRQDHQDRPDDTARSKGW